MAYAPIHSVLQEGEILVLEMPWPEIEDKEETREEHANEMRGVYGAQRRSASLFLQQLGQRQAHLVPHTTPWNAQCQLINIKAF